MHDTVSITPGFSPVPKRAQANKNRFNGFFAIRKGLKRLAPSSPSLTRLKPGASLNARVTLFDEHQ
jgi:hypothetical protein